MWIIVESVDKSKDEHTFCAMCLVNNKCPVLAGVGSGRLARLRGTGQWDCRRGGRATGSVPGSGP